MRELRRIRGAARLAAAAAFAGAMLAGCGGAEEPPACENPVAGSDVTMADFSYEPTCVEAAAGDALEIVNEGHEPHTFTVEADAGAEVDVPAGERAMLSVPDLAAGTYRVICTYHPQMEAALRVSG
ncbi:MAG: cupredoxin domain-containing protein [Actinomycetota bacterium]